MKQNTFDCVKMKHDIQQRIQREMGGLSTQEKRRRTEEAIVADPLLGRIWRDVRRVRTTNAAPST